MRNMIINLAGLLLIALIIWWFWLKHTRAEKVEANSVVEIKVKDGVYQPARIQVKVGQPVTLRFIREDASPCASMVVFGQFEVSGQLAVNKPTDIVLTPKAKGEFEFTCQMGMYRGKLIVE